jgi:uncharacterized membrane protein required for colicin V production
LIAGAHLAVPWLSLYDGRRMGFNLLDILLLLYIAWSVHRGYRRGLAVELPRLVNVLVPVLTGYGLYRWTGWVLKDATRLMGLNTHAPGVLTIMFAAWWLVWRFRVRLHDWVARKFLDETQQKRGGAAVRGARALVLGSAIIVFIGLLPLGFLNRPFSQGSLVGRNLIHYVVPVYETVTGKSPGKPR